MAEWLPALAAAIAREGRAVLVTVAHANGSTPREAGAAMVISADAMHGTIGGGHLEFEALRIARDALSGDPRRGAWLVRFPLAARLGQCCGGVATLGFAVLDAQAADWLEPALACQRASVPMALVSRIGGAAGARMQLLVTADHARGSLGTPALDSAAVSLARPRVQARAAGACLVDAIEAATLLIHTLVPDDFHVLVFGNGHVGRALVQVLGALPARVRWIDGREHAFPAGVPGNVEIVASDAPEDEAVAARPGAFAVIATHSHALDFDIVAAALARDDWRYLGLIGSQAKRNQFARRLAVRGLGGDAFARVTCPIGVSQGLAIRSKEPGAIAVAVAAEMLSVRERHAARASPRAVVAFTRGRSAS